MQGPEGRIQMRKTNRLQIIKSSLQRTAGPYKGATTDSCTAAIGEFFRPLRRRGRATLVARKTHHHRSFRMMSRAKSAVRIG